MAKEKQPKKSPPVLPASLRVTVGKGKRVDFTLRPETKFTAKNVQGGRGETCGTTTVKSGKNKGKVKSKPCPKPCGLIKPPVDKNGKKLTQRCPVQLAYDQGQPFLRFCTKKGMQGYRIDVSSPADAMEKSTKLCGEWEAKKKKFSFPKGHPLAGSTSSR